MLHDPAFRLRVAVILLALLSSCSEASTGPQSRAVVARDESSGLEQRVTITPALPAAGDAVEIRSVITNTGTEPIMVSSRTCGLNYQGTLALLYPGGSAACGGFSTSGLLAPGESRTQSDFNRVDSPRGVYALRVGHAIQPELWAQLVVVVRGT